MLDIQERIKLDKYTSWNVGGEAEYFCLPKTLAEIQEAQAWALKNKHPVTILGGGSNVLISDKGVKGLTICLRQFSGIQSKEVSGRLTLEALAGTSKSELLKVFLKNKLAPALFLAGLPGDLGGGIVMNAGVSEAFVPREFAEIVDWIEVLKADSSLQKYAAKEITWKYRNSQGWQPGIIVNIGLSWPMQADTSILVQVKEANRIRLQKQPLDLPSCGSVFINPPGKKAAQLVESCGLKGYTVGGAQVSAKHANFIVNVGKARAADMAAVIEKIKSTVLKERGVALQSEVIFLGDWTD